MAAAVAAIGIYVLAVNLGIPNGDAFLGAMVLPGGVIGGLIAKFVRGRGVSS